MSLVKFENGDSLIGLIQGTTNKNNDILEELIFAKENFIILRDSDNKTWNWKVRVLFSKFKEN